MKSRAARPLVFLLGLTGASAAHAQAAANATAPKPSEQVAPTADPAVAAPAPEAVGQTAVSQDATGDVIVTGSRISRRDYVSESPIVTVGQAAIAATGSPNLEATLNQLPQLTTSASAASNFTGRGGQASADLRGLGQQRTLVLLDGHRLQPSSADGSIDLNTIPADLIGSAEVITGGASAVYGSDAVTGVVNLKVRRDAHGVELSGRYNLTDKGDGAIKDVSLIAGSRFHDNRAYALFSVGHTERDPVQLNARGYLRNQVASTIISEGNITAIANNLPSAATVNALFAKYGFAPGTVPANAAFAFNTDGTLFTRGSTTTGPINFRSPPSVDVGVYNNNLYYFGANRFYDQTQQKRTNVFSLLEYDVTSDIKFTGQLLFNDINVTAQRANTVLGGGASAPILIPVTNPFIPADVRSGPGL